MGDSQTVITPHRIGDYVFRGTIGEGAFSVVKLVYKETTKEYFACKIVPQARIQVGNLQARFELEIRISQQLHHPGIVSLVDLLKDAFNYYVIIEFCPNGELFQYILDHSRLSENEARPLIRQIINTLKFIHKNGVCHRDLKPENILIDKFGRLKISDFGLSRFMPEDSMVSTPCGSPCYASPECISGNKYSGRTNDVWSMGVIIYAMITGQLPWTKRNQKQLFEQIANGDYTIPNFVSETCQDLIRKMMCVDVTKRIALDQVLEHPFFIGMTPYIPMSTGDLPIVSLRRVDAYFAKEGEDLTVPEPKPRECVSQFFTKLDKTVAAITPAKKPIEVRKRPTITLMRPVNSTRPMPWYDQRMMQRPQTHNQIDKVTPEEQDESKDPPQTVPPLSARHRPVAVESTIRAGPSQRPVPNPKLAPERRNKREIITPRAVTSMRVKSARRL